MGATLMLCAPLVDCSQHTRKASHQSSVVITSTTICSLTISRRMPGPHWKASMMCAVDYVIVPPASTTGAPPAGSNSTRTRQSLLSSVSALV